jgi:hypothetical protein
MPCRSAIALGRVSWSLLVTLAMAPYPSKDGILVSALTVTAPCPRGPQSGAVGVYHEAHEGIAVCSPRAVQCPSSVAFPQPTVQDIAPGIRF